VAGVIAVIAIAVTAVFDHRHKNAALLPRSDAAWYCEHKHVRCDEARQAASIESRWHARETGYKGAFVLISGVTVVLGAGALYRGQRGRRTRP